MDIDNKLVLLKKQFETEFKDITDCILSFEKDGKSYFISLNNGHDFHAKLENVIVLEKQKDIDLLNNGIIYQNRIKTDIIKIEFYSNKQKMKKYKLYCENGYNFICNAEDLKFYKLTKDDKSLIEYWKSCACGTGEETIRNMMKSQYETLDVEPQSVLYSYINKSNTIKEINDNIICPFNFNNSQIKAIRAALKKKISIIKGPPGTGKTETILNIICNLIIRGKSIAIISANNSAIENIEEKLRNYKYDNLLASLGNGERKAEFFKNQIESSHKDKISRNDISPNKLALLSKLFESENLSKSIKEKIEAIKLEQSYYEQFNRDKIVDVSKYRFKDSQSLIEYVTKYQDDTKEKKFTFFLWLKLIFKYGFRKSLLRAKDRDQITTSLEYKFYTLKIEELSKELKEVEELLKNKKLEDLKSEYKLLSKQNIDSFIFSNIDYSLSFTQKDYKKRFSEFIKRYPIITSTAISFMTSIKSAYLFDYVIIDESSQVTIPSTIPLLNKCKNIVVVGDDKQLSPIEQYSVACNFDNAFDSNKQSLITSFMLIYKDSITTLLEHYRCDPAIIGFSNLKYYDSQLIPFTESNNDASSLSVYFTTSGNHMRKIYDGEQNGTYNQREIDTIKEILNDKNKVNSLHENIGIISPYRLQADKLQSAFPDIECDTIHKFQGREKDVIIFSAVLDGKAAKKDFMFVDNANMINVTASRAIKQFILVTDEDVFNEKGKEIHDLINYISYKSKNENLFKSRCVSIFDFLYKSKEEQRNKLLKESASKSNYASEKLLRILLDKILKLDSYKQFTIQEQVKIKDLKIDTKKFDSLELSYIQNNCSVDFLIKDKVNQDIVCVIEVDGVSYHENNKKQQQKDALKNSILSKCNITLLRLKTNGSNEEFKIKQLFDSYINKFKPKI